MPYIEQHKRGEPATMVPYSVGELNYLISIAMIDATDEDAFKQSVQNIVDRYRTVHPLSYQTINDIMGATLCAAAEYNRRTGKEKLPYILGEWARNFYYEVAVPYENTKRETNGDIYGND